MLIKNRWATPCDCLTLGFRAGADFLSITRTQYNKITKAKTDCRNIELKLSKSQVTKNDGAIGAIIAKIMPHIIKHAPKVLGTLEVLPQHRVEYKKPSLVVERKPGVVVKSVMYDE